MQPTGGPLAGPVHRTLVASPCDGPGVDLLIGASAGAHGAEPVSLVQDLQDLHDVPSGRAVLVVAGPVGGPDAALEWLGRAAGLSRDLGLDRASVVLDAGLDRAGSEPVALALLAATTDLAALGHPVAVSLDGPAGPAEAVASAAVAAGCGVLRSGDPRSARRIADLLDALLLERAGAPGAPR